MRSVTSSPPEAVVLAPDEGTTPDDAFGVYVHVPYCARACPYCDFDFRVDARPDGAAFLAGLAHEVRTRADVRIGQAAHTLYVGGGTPSVLGADDLRALLAWMGQTWDGSQRAEWTVEFNPEHADPARLDALVSQGVSRVSLGVQSFDAGGLRQLGRAHDAAAAVAAVKAAAERGLEVSLDLIVGWPGQTLDGLRAELDVVLGLPVDHVSIYALTIEAGTPWERLAERGVRRLPRAEDAADALECTAEVLAAAGFVHYEVASYARGDAFARHNSGYWLGRDYVGLGPSAASARSVPGGVERRSNARGARWWQGEAPSVERLDAEERAREALWLALRLLQGVEIDPFLRRIDRDLAWLEARTARARARGNVALHGGRLRVAEGRWLHHDDIAADVL